MRIRESARPGYAARLLVVCPDHDLRGALAAQLALAGHRVVCAATGAEAVRLLTGGGIDLIVVDVEIPDLRALSDDRPALGVRPPVLCLAACEFLGTLVPALGTEVEDYVTKPCRAPELLARVEVLLRDHLSRDLPQPGPRTELSHGDLVLDEVTCRAWRGDRPLELTPAEYRLLRHLLLNAGRVLSKEQLAREVWNEGRRGGTIERLVSRLRQKVDAAPPALIRTRKGFGYLLDE